MALYERERSGKGRAVDMALYDCALALMFPHFPNYFLSGKVPGLTGNAHPNLVPYDKFQTRTGDIFLGAGNNKAFEKIADVLGAPELAKDPRFKDNGARRENVAALRKAIEQRLADVDGGDFAARMLAAGVPCGPVVDSRQALEHPHTAHRGMVVEQGWYKGAGTPIKFSRTPARMRSAPPRFSEHAHEILREAGFDDAAIAKLAETGVLAEKRRR